MYPADAETDENFRLMSLEERGMFWTLLNHAWINDGIPFETMRLSRLCGITEERFKSLWKCVGECFYLDNGRMRNKRQEEERTYAIEKSKKATDAVRTRYGRSTNELPRAYESVSVSVSVSEDSKKKEKVVDFGNFDIEAAWLEFHALYPLKGQSRMVDAKRYYCLGLIDAPEPEKLHRHVMERIQSVWVKSDKWARGFVMREDEFIRQRSWDENPPEIGANGARKGIDWEEVAR